MGKYAYGLMRIFRWASQDPEGFWGFLLWLLSAGLECLIVGGVFAGIAWLTDNEEDLWFECAFGVMAVLEIIVGVIQLFA